MGKIQNYEDLVVYKKADGLAFEVYLLTKKFPKSELYGLTSQLRRSILSVPANIVEGFVRKGNKEFIQFLYISLSSLAESEYYIKFANKLELIEEEEKLIFLEKTTEVARMIRGLIKSINNKS